MGEGEEVAPLPQGLDSHEELGELFQLEEFQHTLIELC